MKSTLKFFSGNFIPETLDYSNANVLGRLRPAMKKNDRIIDWQTMSTSEIVNRIYAADGSPGARAQIQG